MIDLLAVSTMVLASESEEEFDLNLWFKKCFQLGRFDMFFARVPAERRLEVFEHAAMKMLEVEEGHSFIDVFARDHSVPYNDYIVSKFSPSVRTLTLGYFAEATHDFGNRNEGRYVEVDSVYASTWLQGLVDGERFLRENQDDLARITPFAIQVRGGHYSERQMGFDFFESRNGRPGFLKYASKKDGGCSDRLFDAAQAFGKCVLVEYDGRLSGKRIS